MATKINMEIGLLNALYIGNLLSKEKSKFKDNLIMNEAIEEFIEILKAKKLSRSLPVATEVKAVKK